MPSSQRLFSLEDMFSVKKIREAKLSPDGKNVIYCCLETDEKENLSFSNLFLVDSKTGVERQLTFGKKMNYSFNWMPDSKGIVFLSTRNDSPQVFSLSLAGGEAVQLTSMKQPIGGAPVCSPDGKWIAFTAGKLEEPRDLAQPYRVDRFIYRFDDAGYLDDVVQDVYILPSSGGEPKRLTDDRFNNANLVWSPDSQKLAFLPMADPDAANPFAQQIRLISLEGEMESILEGWGDVGTIFWPDTDCMYLVAQPKGLPIGSKNDLWKLPLDSCKPVCLTADMENGIGEGISTDLGIGWESILGLDEERKTAWVNVQEGGQLQVCQISLDGKPKPEKIVSGEHSSYLMGKSENELILLRSELFNPCDLFKCDLDGNNEKQLTTLNEELLSEIRKPEVERLLFKSEDGQEVEGWIMKPDQVEAPYPTILFIHGGPHAAYGYGFTFDFWWATANGFAALFINHRASTGYGQKFATQIKGDWGNLDYKDLMAGVDFCIEKGLVDGDRLGCTGNSGGGYLSCWIVSHTDRFKAAMPENSLINWSSFYGTSDIGVWFGLEEMGGHPHEIPEVYAKCSPITFAHLCKTPTLLMQGEIDYRCPAEQSEQFYTILKANGCTVEMVRYPNSFHGGMRSGPLPTRRMHREALIDWMKRYLLGETVSDKKENQKQ